MNRDEWRQCLQVPPIDTNSKDEYILYNAYRGDITGVKDPRDWLDSVEAHETACKIIDTFDKDSTKEDTPQYVSEVVYQALFAHNQNYKW